MAGFQVTFIGRIWVTAEDLDAAFLEYRAQAYRCPRTVKTTDVFIFASRKKGRKSPAAGRYAHEFCVAAHKLFLPFDTLLGRDAAFLYPHL